MIAIAGVFAFATVNAQSGTRGGKTAVVSKNTPAAPVAKKDGTVNTYLRGDDFRKYQKLTMVFSSLRYRNKLIDTEEAEQDFVHFILTFVIVNYELT